MVCPPSSVCHQPELPDNFEIFRGRASEPPKIAKIEYTRETRWHERRRRLRTEKNRNAATNNASIKQEHVDDEQ